MRSYFFILVMVKVRKFVCIASIHWQYFIFLAQFLFHVDISYLSLLILELFNYNYTLQFAVLTES